MTQHWIAVASADHVRRGLKGGFMQVSHGKLGPLKKIAPSDRVAYYSPTEIYGNKDQFQSFTAVGTVREGEPYDADMGGGFVPCRRDVEWDEANQAPIHPLLEQLEFTAGKRNWGYQLRFGLFKASADDFAIIESAMNAKRPRQ